MNNNREVFARNLASANGVRILTSKEKIKVMYKTQLVTTKGDSIRTFISSSRPATRFGSEGVEIRSNDDKNNFMVMGSFNVIVEQVEK